jgi:Zn-finger nucleic acid-binding protein
VSGFEARLPCPVCLGTRMEKVSPPGSGLTLDHCRRCGGTWFDHGEVQRLRTLPPTVLEERAAPRPPRPMLCHVCHAPVDRDQERCGGCGWTVALDCPVCERAMRTDVHSGVRLDFCGGCRGVWFDRRELAAIWTAGFALAAGRPPSAAMTASMDAGGGVVEALFYAPDLVVHGALAGVEVAGAAARGLAAAPEAALTAAEAASEAASGVFSLLLEIVGGLFEGLG